MRIEGLFMLLLGLQEKLGEIVERRLGHPALGALPGPARADELCIDQLLQVMGDGGLPDAEPLAEFPDAKPGTFLGIAAAPFAAGGEAKKNRETVGMREGLERWREFSYAHISMYINITK
jgi:hypothetical protein